MKDAIKYLEEKEDLTISPQELSEILGGGPFAYTMAAKEGKLTLPYIWRGNRLRIFKAPLLTILKGGKP